MKDAISFRILLVFFHVAIFVCFLFYKVFNFFCAVIVHALFIDQFIFQVFLSHGIKYYVGITMQYQYTSIS